MEKECTPLTQKGKSRRPPAGDDVFITRKHESGGNNGKVGRKGLYRRKSGNGNCIRGCRGSGCDARDIGKE